MEHPLDQYVWDVRYAKAPVVRFHDGNTDGDYDGGAQEGDNALYYTHDANWNTTAVVAQATGAVAERYFYDAYGQAHFADDSWDEIQWSGSLQNEVLYGGYGLDAESGLYHTDAREYHCTLGRFVQVDPLGLAAGPNVYAYCNDSPADTVDPSGLEPDWAKAATGIMMVALSAMQTQAAISLGGSVFGMLGVTAGYGGFAAGMAMIVSAFRPDPRLDQVAETGAMIQLVASAPAFGASVIAAGRSMLRRGGAVFNGVRVAEQQVAFKTAHAARHLQGTGLASETVESAITGQIQQAARGATATGEFWGRVTVQEQVIEYHAFTLPDKTISVGTYYIPR
ncbi:MAG: RHS repeat-associated core domain-containing protein [Planctomycetota bacterium]|nr:RHS repeat-associated core domain-containing protein [Planctomycetota bacterium]